MNSSSSSNGPEPAVGRAKIFKAAKYMMLKGFEDFPGAWSAMHGFRGRAITGPGGYARPAFVVSFLHLPSIGEGAVALFEGGHLLALCKS